MPTSKNWSTIGIMTIGVSSNQNDVGGSAGEHQNQLKAHGGSFNDRLVQIDGLMNANMACNYSCTGISTNDASTQELSYEFGAISAEVAGGGVRVNIIPKDGGNRFSGSGFFNYANDSLQGNNIDDALRSQGVTTGDSILRIHDLSGAIGGPLKKDKLWFWTAHRFWGYEQIRTNTFYEKNPFDFVFDPDPDRPGTESQHNVNDDLRLTWQISPRNKVSGYVSYAPRNTNHWILGSTFQPDASNLQNLPINHFESFTFRSTLTSKALFEAAMGNTSETWTREPVEDSETSKGYPVTEQTTGINFRAYNGTFSRNYTSLRSYRSSLTYVTGSHAIKVGFNLQEGPADTDVYTNNDTAITVRLGQPFQVTVRTTPYTDARTAGGRSRRLRAGHVDDQADDGERRPALGLPEQQGRRAGCAGRHVDRPAAFRRADRRAELQRSLAAPRPRLRSVRQRQDRAQGDAEPLRADLDGRLCAAAQPAQHVGQQRDAAVDADANGDGIPQPSELGALSNNAFGQVNIATQLRSGNLSGFRQPAQQLGSVDHRVARADVARRRGAVVLPPRAGTLHDHRQPRRRATDFQQYCVTAPRDPRLPGGGGNQVCGLYDIVPTKFGVATNNIVTSSTTTASRPRCSTASTSRSTRGSEPICS